MTVIDYATKSEREDAFVRQAALDEIFASPLYAMLANVAREAERVFSAACAREHARSGRSPAYRPVYTSVELLAEAVLEALGDPSEPLDRDIAAICEFLVNDDIKRRE